MNVVDPLVLGALAIADMAVLVRFRQSQARRYRMKRMYASLAAVVRKDNEPAAHSTRPVQRTPVERSAV